MKKKVPQEKTETGGSQKKKKKKNQDQPEVGMLGHKNASLINGACIF